MNGSKRILPILAAALFLTACTGCGRTGGAEYVKKGVAAADRGDWEGALKFASKGVERSPRSIDALLLKALAARQCGRPNQARAAAEAAVNVDPHNFSAQFMLGWVCLDDPNSRVEARRAFEAALKLRPNDCDTLIALCNLAAERDPREMLVYLSLLESRCPAFVRNSSAFHNQRGVAYLRTGRGARAAFEEFKLAIRMKSGWNDPQVVYNVACIGDLQRSVPAWRLKGWYEHYLELTRNDGSAAVKRQLVLERLKRL